MVLVWELVAQPLVVVLLDLELRFDFVDYSLHLIYEEYRLCSHPLFCSLLKYLVVAS